MVKTQRVGLKNSRPELFQRDVRIIYENETVLLLLRSRRKSLKNVRGYPEWLEKYCFLFFDRKEPSFFYYLVA